MAAHEPSVAPVPVICGPTAAGKSAVALWLAEHTGATIVVADSRQVYRGFDIGTAKPAAAERAHVPHVGIDVIPPTARYSAAAWATAADAWLADCAARSRPAFIAGGTGFYLRALFAPLFDEPAVDEPRRAALARFLAPAPRDTLIRWTRALDPERAHLGRTQLLRAIEIALLTGRRLSALHREEARPARRTARYLLVDPGPALGARIAHRLDAMLAAGWIDEVRALAARVPADAPAWKATGYRTLRDLIAGSVSFDAARETILIETRRYAKRQRTWFRHQLSGETVTMLDPTAPEWQSVVSRWWDSFAAGEGVR